MGCMIALHRYSTEIRLAVLPGPRWKSRPMASRPVASIELLIGLRVAPRRSGAVKRHPKGWVVAAVRSVVAVRTPEIVQTC
ncbi:hypothetical protein GCM10009543_02750 [Leifsonia naganoensis]